MFRRKHYALFAGENYYPQGGARDFRGKFRTVDDALGFARLAVAPIHDWDDWWLEVVDLRTWEILTWRCIDETGEEEVDHGGQH